jgi:transposase
MTKGVRQSPKKPTKAEQLNIVIGLINGGKSQAAAAKAVGLHLRTVQRWLAEPEVRQKLETTRKEVQAIAKADPVVLSLTEIRQQIDEILSYRDSQRRFAVEMGEVVFRAVVVIKKAVERLEINPDEVSIRSIPPLLKAITDASEKVSNSWSRSVGLDGLLDTLKDESQVISQRETEA